MELKLLGSNDLEFIIIDRNEEVKPSDIVKHVRVKAVWMGRNYWAGIGNSVTGLLTTANPTTYSWVEIETYSGWYYCVQFGKPKNITMTRCDSDTDVTACGLANVGYSAHIKSRIVSVKYSVRVDRKVTMHEVTDFIKRYNASEGCYNLVSNNCQHFGKAFYYWIVEQDEVKMHEVATDFVKKTIMHRKAAGIQ